MLGGGLAGGGHAGGGGLLGEAMLGGGPCWERLLRPPELTGAIERSLRLISAGGLHPLSLPGCGGCPPGGGCMYEKQIT